MDYFVWRDVSRLLPDIPNTLPPPTTDNRSNDPDAQALVIKLAREYGRDRVRWAMWLIQRVRRLSEVPRPQQQRFVAVVQLYLRTRK